MFGFGLQEAILSFDKQQLINKADTTLRLCPQGKGQLIFIENHDIDRFATLVKNVEKQKVAAAIQLLIESISRCKLIRCVTKAAVSRRL